MLGLRKTLKHGALVVFGTCVIAACSGSEFVASQGSSGRGSSGQDSASGAVGNADMAGEASSSSGSSNDGGTGIGGASATAGASSAGKGGLAAGGGAGKAGAAGAGGAATVGCTCTAGHYCRDGSTDCYDCSSVTRLKFATPERLATLAEPGKPAHFPRNGSSGLDLLYRQDGTGLRYTTDASTSAGNNVSSTTPQDSGPLLVGTEITSVIGQKTLLSFNFFFDRLGEANRRSLFIGKWQNGLQKFEEAPAPYNGGNGDYSIAVAVNATAEAPRAFWMTRRDMPKPTLVTALLAPNATSAPVNLTIGPNKCAAVDEDLTPWVTPEGGRLFVSHTRPNANCTADTQGKDIYYAALAPATGVAAGSAQLMDDVNSSKDDVEPSFSPDLCDLYFASNRDGAYALYRAHRH